MDLEVKKKALRKIVHGVYVVGVKDKSHLNAFTATWITQVSFQPPLVAVGINQSSISFRMIQDSRVFVINFLGSGQKLLAQHFLKPAHLGGDKLAGIRYRLGATGAPILEEAMAFVECEVRAIHPAGDHSIVVGEVVEAGVGPDADPLTLQETGWHYGG